MNEGAGELLLVPFQWLVGVLLVQGFRMPLAIRRLQGFGG